MCYEPECSGILALASIIKSVKSISSNWIEIWYLSGNVQLFVLERLMIGPDSIAVTIPAIDTLNSVNRHTQSEAFLNRCGFKL